nr:heparinase II/III family protein [Cohnella zeiphila]
MVKVKEALAQGAPADLGWYYPGGDAAGFWRRALREPGYADMLEEVREEGRRLRGTPIPELKYSLFTIYVERGSRREYEQAYFERRRRLNTFALLSMTEPDEPGYLEELIDIVWAICGEYTWCVPAHVPGTDAQIRETIDLFSAETGFALAEISLLLGDRLPRLVRERVERELEIRLFGPFTTRESFHWESMRNNWSAVCAGSVGSAALLSVRDPDRLAQIARRTFRSLDCFLEGYGEDGACPEGLNYWTYGFGYYVYYADLLGKRTGGEIDLFGGEKVRHIAQFQQKAYLGGDRVANFSDSSPRARFQPGLTHYLAGRYPGTEVPPLRQRAAFTDDHCSRWAHAFRNLLWLNPGLGGADWPAADYYLPDAQWMVSRHLSPAGAFGFAAKAGHNAESHNHNDIGQFLLLADGETFVADLGSGEYTKTYFGEGRYEYDCNGSQGHTVPVVDGTFQAEGEESAARVLEASVGEEEDRFRFQMASAYRVPQLESLVRGFVWRKGERPSLEVTDEFRFAKAPGEAVERIVSLLAPELTEDGVLLRGTGDRVLNIRFDGSLLEPRIERRTYRAHLGRETAWYAIDFVPKVPVPLQWTVSLLFEFV